MQDLWVGDVIRSRILKNNEEPVLFIHSFNNDKFNLEYIILHALSILFWAQSPFPLGKKLYLRDGNISRFP